MAGSRSVASECKWKNRPAAAEGALPDSRDCSLTLLGGISLDYAISSQHLLIQEIETLFLEKLCIRVDAKDADLFQTGTLDSVAMVRLLLHLEERFGVRLPMEDLGVESFRSVDEIANVVASRLAQA